MPLFRVRTGRRQSVEPCRNDWRFGCGDLVGRLQHSRNPGETPFMALLPFSAAMIRHDMSVESDRNTLRFVGMPPLLD
ncbi:MAG: hypothetical protein CMN87_18535 [Stappia sp.]|nr:hypothetical protein [Stappia sp.]